MDEQQEQSQEARPAPETPDGGGAVVTGGRALVVYATKHGSTREIADAVATELRAAFSDVDVREAGSAPPPAGYDAVVVGGPMIMGWHRDAARYVKKHRDQLESVPFALFVTAASLTEDGMDAFQGVPVAKDAWLVKKPGNADKLRRKERYALPSHYLGDISKACAPARPRTVAFLAGSLDLTTMNVFEKLFVLLIVGATPGDGRHWDFARDWAAEAAKTLSAG
ncbi:MAG TPA: flavodoxin domain-containing protein [Thermoleophilia bacterium]